MEKKKIRVLFVCLGNICRSPMAEMTFNQLAQQEGLDNCIEADSAATSTEELGNPMYPPARAELARHHVPCLPHRARAMIKADYQDYDLLIGMEDSNISNMLRIAGGDPQKKIHKLMDYTKQGGNVQDPWYTSDFGTAYQHILAGCKGLIEVLKQNSH